MIMWFQSRIVAKYAQEKQPVGWILCQQISDERNYVDAIVKPRRLVRGSSETSSASRRRIGSWHCVCRTVLVFFIVLDTVLVVADVFSTEFCHLVRHT